MANRLAAESSPYLLQHQNNPVDWYPWGPEALERAKREDRPIFLSIGYSACHWCHVMEHESFENPAIAERLNAAFVCIKVDREERPDLDQIYMHAVQLMTGRGGWPMSVFLTPDLQPFFGGTYWPPSSRGGMPGFDQVLHAVTQAWKSRREEAIEQAENLTEHLKDFGNYPATGQGLRDDLIHAAVGTLERIFDFTHGGFGGAPKFPHSMDLQLLLRAWRRSPRTGLLDMVRITLDHMARGGIYDHLAGGFARYSVDARWLVPHFEKMLYDNGLLTLAYLESFRATGDSSHARIARETLDYVLSYMTDSAGGFHSTEDADSEGVEGKFYVWTPAEIRDVLGPERGNRFCYAYDVTEHGNFEHGQSILHLPKPISQAAAVRGWNAQELDAELADSRARLLAVRDRRVRPGKDDKILVSWNALMIDALAQASGLLDGGRRYRDTAVRAAEFLLTQLRRPDGRLLHSWRHGQARFDAYLDDYAYLANALVSLYEATFDERWIDEAVVLVEQMVRHFADPEAGGFFFTADDHEQLIARPKDLYDSSVPSGNAMAATVLVRLGKLLGRDAYLELARRTLDIAMGLMERSPTATGQMLIAAELLLASTAELVIVGDPDDAATAEVMSVFRRRFLPHVQVACRPPTSVGSSGVVGGARDARRRRSSLLDPLFAGRESPTACPAVYVCEQHACRAPAIGKQAALEAIERL